MRTLRTRVLLASVLAIGAQLAGCGDADCPSSVAEQARCSTAGLTCYNGGSESCTCTSGVWQCGVSVHDMAIPDLARHDMLPLGD